MDLTGTRRRSVGTSGTFHRQPASAPLARRFVRNALGGGSSDAVERLVLATAEAVSNVIEHARGPTFTARVVTDGASGVVTVVDDGPGFAVPPVAGMPPADEIGGRGLALIYQLVDHADVASSPAGTIVTLTQQLSPAQPATAPPLRTITAGCRQPRRMATGVASTMTRRSPRTCWAGTGWLGGAVLRTLAARQFDAR